VLYTLEITVRGQVIDDFDARETSGCHILGPEDKSRSQSEKSGPMRGRRIEEQMKDAELRVLAYGVLMEEDVTKVPVFYFKKDGVLMR